MPYRSIIIPQVDIWGPYYRSLEGIGQGIGNVAGGYFGRKQRRKDEEEAYRKQREREEQEYQIRKRREEEEYRTGLKRKEELDQASIAKAYQGYLGLRRPEIYDESGQQIASPAPVAGVPSNLPTEYYGKMIESELVKQGRLPGIKNEFSISDGYLLNKDIGVVTPIPGWKPKPPDSLAIGKTDTRQDKGQLVTYQIIGYDANGLPIEKEIARSPVREGPTPDAQSEQRANRIRGEFRRRAFEYLQKPDSYTDRNRVPDELKDAEQYLMNRATELYAYNGLREGEAWDTALAEVKKMGLIPQPPPPAPPKKGWFDWWKDGKTETPRAIGPTPTPEDALSELQKRGITIDKSGAIVRNQQSADNTKKGVAVKQSGPKQPLYTVEKTLTGKGIFNQPTYGHRELYNPEVGKVYLKKDKVGVNQLGGDLYAYRKVRFLGYRNGEPQFKVIDKNTIPID